jgi:hypothetical protein
MCYNALELSVVSFSGIFYCVISPATEAADSSPMDDGSNSVLMLPLFCLLLYFVTAHSEGDHIVIVNKMHIDGMARQLGPGKYSAFRKSLCTYKRFCKRCPQVPIQA